MMVIVPLPWVWIRVRATTSLPERPGPWGDTPGRQAKTPTGCLRGLLGGIKILLFMSFNVMSPSSPPGFTSPKGYTIFLAVPLPAVLAVITAFLLLILSLSLRSTIILH
uniref:Uncharacterized protein n=1 Tax=Opuntia streptacantha TaxID=393608 RepID=A0A7C8ZXT0_OPUST